MRFYLPIAVVSSISFFLFATEARADDAPPAPPPTAAASSADATTTAPAASAAPAQDKDKAKPQDGDEEDLKHVAITVNPLSLILMRIGANVEYMFVKHHGVSLNPYFQSISAEASAGSTTSKSTYTTFGAELGYRFYTGSRGANGFFLGPAVFLQHTSGEATASAAGSSASANSSMTVYGGILDIGGQHVTKGGFTIGAGVGVMYLVASGTPGATSSTVKFEGVLPRFLLTAGYAF